MKHIRPTSKRIPLLAQQSANQCFIACMISKLIYPDVNAESCNDGCYENTIKETWKIIT